MLCESSEGGPELALQVIDRSKRHFDQLQAGGNQHIASSIKELIKGLFQTMIAALINANITTCASLEEQERRSTILEETLEKQRA